MAPALLMFAAALSTAPEPKLEDGPLVAVNASLSIPVSSSDYPDTDLGGGWGVYGGHFWSLPHRLKISFGIGFEHIPLNVTLPEDNGDLFRWHPELRIGAGGHRLWGYGIIAPGIAAWTPRTDIGFDLNIGAGLSGIVWRGLILGAELHFDFGHFGDETPRFEDPVRRRYSTLGPTIVAGWLF